MYVCTICNKEFETRYKHNAHKAHHSKEELQRDKELKERTRVHNPKNIPCEKCGKIFKHYANYQKHIVKCNGLEKYICNVCNVEFRSKNSLHLHNRAKHSNNSINKKELFTCLICNKGFYTNKGSFNNHVKSHDENFVKQKGQKISKTKQEFFSDKERSKEYLDGLSKRKKGQKHTKETKALISSKLKRYFAELPEDRYNQVVSNFINAPKKGNAANHYGKYTPTSIEQIVIDFDVDGLNYNGNKKDAIAIRFENKTYKKSVVPDFIYKDGKKFIETFGCYWHSIEDEEKYTKAYKENGYEVLIIWENELLANREKFKEIILNFLEKNES